MYSTHVCVCVCVCTKRGYISPATLVTFHKYLRHVPFELSFYSKKLTKSLHQMRFLYVRNIHVNGAVYTVSN